MRQNAKNVLSAFARGQAHDGGTISTNGREVFSYKTVIARREKDSTLTVINRSYSHTTATHLTAILTFFAGQNIKQVDRLDPI